MGQNSAPTGLAPPGFARPAGYQLRRRVRDWLAGQLRPRRRRSRSFRVEIQGVRLKRTVLADSYSAARVAAHLAEFAADRVYPRLLFECDRELWLEWIEGEAPLRPDREVIAQVARLFSVLHRRKPRKVASDDTPFPRTLRCDLDFLYRVGLLNLDTVVALRQYAEAATPEELWVGYDCTDPALENFVRADDGRIWGVDPDGLRADQLLGIGPATVCQTWIGPYRDALLSELRSAGSPDFRRYFEFVELVYLASWQKTCFLTGERRSLDPSRFDRFALMPCVVGSRRTPEAGPWPARGGRA